MDNKIRNTRSYDYLIELKEGNIDYWYIRYVDRTPPPERGPARPAPER